MRKTPSQARAQATVETIYAATARIVENDGETALTTNRIAAEAGFSIGTLYQYFPSKESVVLAMLQRRREQAQVEIQALLDTALAQRLPILDVVRQLVRLMVGAFGGESRNRRRFIRLGWKLDHHDQVTQALREGAERHALALAQLVAARDAAGEAVGVRSPQPAMMFVMTRAVMGTIRSACLEDSPLLGTAAFEDELVTLAWGMLRND
ncbi:TetR family transcriptional regulator [Xylophilus sp. Kf1]|nr:TetR family transcriptional regulator [Xylophilus sp. Kf1]